MKGMMTSEVRTNPLLALGMVRCIAIFACLGAWVVFTIHCLRALIEGQPITRDWLFGSYANAMAAGLIGALVHWYFVVNKKTSDPQAHRKP